jgi:hypothetical protein
MKDVTVVTMDIWSRHVMPCNAPQAVDNDGSAPLTGET